MAAGSVISEAIRNAKASGRPALVGWVTAGFPRRETFVQQLSAVAEASDVVEIGVPFTTRWPMAPRSSAPAARHSHRVYR
jgi:tryptophan synthase alpha chain